METDTSAAAAGHCAKVLLAAEPGSALALCACSLSTQRAAATVPLRTEVKLVTCAQLSEAGS